MVPDNGKNMLLKDMVQPPLPTEVYAKITIMCHPQRTVAHLTTGIRHFDEV